MKQYIFTDVSTEYPLPSIPLSAILCLPPLASSCSTLLWHVTSGKLPLLSPQSSCENQNSNFP